ncbi:hypothetical protein [Mesobacillus sp.]|uniref:hypothetical protein n=1 Tax=Mesobacillus sp. TaxID=2675271 RepID=UPI0039EF7967
MKSCQEKRGIKTGLVVKGEKLSKVRATSDRFGVKGRKAVRRKLNLDRFWIKRRKAVRRKLNFGQVLDQTKKSCQKKAQLWTGLALKEEKLSKVSSTSDKFGIKRRKAVRSKSNFGQVWHQKKK